MGRLSICLILGGLLVPGVARADDAVPRPRAVFIAVAVNGGTIARVEPAEWKRTDRITLHLVVEAEVEGAPATVFFTGVPVLEVHGQRIEPERVRSWPSSAGELAIRWYEVVNRAQRETPGSPWEDFEELEIEGARDRWRTDVRPGDLKRFPGIPPGVGTGRYAVTVTGPDGASLRTPGATALVSGPADEVARVTLHRDDSFAGWVCAYWGVPYRADAPSTDIESFAAVSAAGLALGAYRAWTGADLPDIQAPPFDDGPWETFLEVVRDRVSGSDGPFHGPESEPVAWGESRTDVRAGDLAVAQGRLAILWSDSGPDGKPDGHLDPDDLVVAADGAPPALIPLRAALPQPMRVLRFRDFTFLQLQLRQLGHYRGRNTGRFDAATQQALLGFQRAADLEPTGMPDQATLVALLRAHRQALGH